MTPTLFIRIPENPETRVQWLYTDGASVDAPVSTGDLSEISQPDTSSEVVVLVPPGVVSLTNIDIPTKNRAQLLKAVPYALEEELAENVDGLHFALSPRRNERTLVAVVQRDWLAALLARLAQQGLTPKAAVPETLCLPWREGDWTLLVEDHGSVLRTGPQEGFALDNGNIEPVIKSLKAAETDDHPAATVHIYDRRQQDRAPLLLPTGDTAMEETGQDPVLVLLARSYFANPPVNLLQGEFAPQQGWHRGWLQWRVAAGLMAAVVAVHLIGVGVENLYLERKRDRLNEAMTELYRATFPDAVRVINPAAQMRNRLAELRQESGGMAAGFMDLVAQAGPSVIGDNKVAVRLLRFRDGRMELDLDADTIERLEALQQRLRGLDLSAELKSVRNEGGRYLARVVVGAQSS